MPARAFYMDCSADMAILLRHLDDKLVGDLDCHHGDPEQHDLPALLKGYPLLFNGHTVMSAELLKCLAPELKRVVFLGTGAASYIDIDAAERLGVEVVTISNYGDRSIAEHAFALLLAGARDVAVMDRHLREGLWTRPSGRELKGKTVGVVGFGGIGREFAGIAQGFGMDIAIWNRSALEPPEGMRLAPDLPDLFRTCDVISIHLAYLSETRHIIGRDLLQSMRPGAILVNTARAGLIDPRALFESLTNGPLGHAALDVFEPEPPADDDPLLTLDNVTLTAHTAWKTPEASRRLLELGLAELWREA